MLGCGEGKGDVGKCGEGVGKCWGRCGKVCGDALRCGGRCREALGRWGSVLGCGGRCEVGVWVNVEEMWKSVLGCGEGKGERCGGVEKCLRCGGR